MSSYLVNVSTHDDPTTTPFANVSKIVFVAVQCKAESSDNLL